MRVLAKQSERGVITLIVAMLVLLLTTLLVAVAVRLSATNLIAVGNVQSRSGAVAAAEKVLEMVVSQRPGEEAFLAGRDEMVDINLDGAADISVKVPVPKCIRALRATSFSANSVTLDGLFDNGLWNTRWEVESVAVDVQTDARVRIVHGMRYWLTEAEKALLCP